MRLPSFLAFLAFVPLLAGPASAQTPDTTKREPRALITGLAHDSINGGPLVGAVVQLVGLEHLASHVQSDTSDSLGRFRFTGVPLGTYLLGFFHPLTDSLGIHVAPETVYVVLPQPMRADVAIPSGARMSAAVCGQGAPRGRDAPATVLGVVSDARTRSPVEGADVVVEWLEWSLSPAGFTQRRRRSTATTSAGGRFALCDVPRDARIALWATRGGDDTDLLELDVPPGGFVRSDLFLGEPKGATGRISGVAVSERSGEPLPGARVRIGEATEVRANARGEWTLSGVPLGTRMIEARAVGYTPTRQMVNVAANEPPVRVALTSLEAVLDTVRVTASRLSADRNGFEQRRRGGHGRFMSAEEIQRRNANETSDLFYTMPGVRVSGSGMDRQFRMRGTTGDCAPTIYVDGHRLIGMSAGDIDGWVRPKDVKGIEVYDGSTAPPQFHPGMSGCGSVVIWTR